MSIELHAIAMFRDFVVENRSTLAQVAHFGDGRCGELLRILQEELLLPDAIEQRRTESTKAVIPRALSKQVFERDAYRCVRCGSWNDLTCDHVVPESRGGETTFENLKTMCRSCNSKKGTKVLTMSAAGEF